MAGIDAITKVSEQYHPKRIAHHQVARAVEKRPQVHTDIAWRYERQHFRPVGYAIN